MASRPRRRVLIDALTRMAHRELGEEATALDLVCDRLESGVTFTKLAAEIGREIGDNWRGPDSGPWIPSRAFVSNVAHQLAPDADHRIAGARKKGAFALAEGALDVAETAPVDSTAHIQRARLVVDQRNALAAAFHPEVFKDRAPVQVNFDFEDLHVLAMQNARFLGLPASQRQPQLAPMPDVDVIPEYMPAALSAARKG